MKRILETILALMIASSFAIGCDTNRKHSLYDEDPEDVCEEDCGERYLFHGGLCLCGPDYDGNYRVESDMGTHQRIVNGKTGEIIFPKSSEKRYIANWPTN